MDGSDHPQPETGLSVVFRVAPTNVTPLWPKIEPAVAELLHDRPTHTSEDVRQSLLKESAQLWIQMWREPEAFIVTEFAVYPRGTWVRVWECGTLPGFRLNTRAFFDQLEMWRKMHGCRGFEAIGRHGWLRRVPSASPEGLVMRSTVDG
jgi:hypothetical protein